MSYPDDDSCPCCGHASSDGRAHIECPWECVDCGMLAVHTDGCKNCKVMEIWENLDAEEQELLQEVIEYDRRCLGKR